jgi:hypothetical protein
MNRPTHKQALWAGLAILFVVNAIALGGAAWNRSQIESQLRLGERELRAPYAWQGDSEDSGVSLALNWRARPAPRSEELAYLMPYSYYGADPGWLDDAKLAALGFNITPPAAGAEDREWRRRVRPVTLVLELDGPAYAESLALAGKDAAEAKAKAAATPTDKSLATAAKEAGDALREEQTKASRLFAVDAGLDRDQLRAKYPDRQRYVLVSALIQTYWHKDKQERWEVSGNIQQLLIPQIHLSRAQATALAPVTRRNDISAYGDTTSAPFEVELAFGRRLEPWLVSARVR